VTSRGLFITLEGGEGAGKSTQSKRLVAALKEHGIPCVATREPGGSPGAEEIRELLVKGSTDRWSATTEALLMTAARNDHVERTILPALQRGEWVICDRFYDSTIAYQGGGGGLGAAKIIELQRWALGDLVPDVTFVFDLPPEKGLARAEGREEETAAGEDRFERVSGDFHSRLRQAYLDIAKENIDRCRIIQADQSVEKTGAAIWAHLSPFIEKRALSDG